MRRRWILAAVLVAAGGAVYLVARSSKGPPLAKAIEDVASSAAALASAYVPLPTVEAGAPEVDAGPPPRHQSGPLSNSQLGAPLVHGTFVSACGAPDTMHVTVKATVRMGKAVTVKVKTTPTDATVAACIEAAVRSKEWDVSPKPGQVTVTY